MRPQDFSLLANAAEEVANVLEQLVTQNPDVFKSLGIRYPLADELGGYAFMLRDYILTVDATHHANHHSQSAGSQSAGSVALQLLEAIRSTHPELIADNLPSGWGMNRLRAEIPKTTLRLNSFDHEGHVASEKIAALSADQLSDIVDHAAQLTLLHREGKELGGVLDELEEALSAADVLPEQSQPPADDQPAPSN